MISRRLTNMICALDEGFGVRVIVETPDSKCGYVQDLTTAEAVALRSALTRSDDLDAVYKQRDEARAKEDAGIKALTLAMEGIERLTKERDAARVDLHVAKETQANLRNEKAALAKQSADLSAAVAQMTEAAEETFSYRDLKDRLADAVSERNRLKQRVAEMTSGKPAAWLVRGQYGYCYRDTEEQARATYQDATLIPLFLANGGPEAAELAAKVEATGKELADARADLDDAAELQRQAENRAFSLEKLLSAEKRMREETRLDLVKAQEERDAWQLSQGTVAREKEALKARVETLLSGEYLAANALAAAEKRAERAEFDRDNAVSGRTSAQHLLKAAEARVRTLETEAKHLSTAYKNACASAARNIERVKVLEGDAVPCRWAVVNDRDSIEFSWKDKADAEREVASRGGTVEPLYRHPPKTGEPVAWLVRYPDRAGANPCIDEETADSMVRGYGCTKVPLYEAPPPAALGVTDERCVVLEVDRLRTVNVKGPDHLIGSRAQAEERAKALHGTAYRLVPIDAPVVDIAAIRKALATLRGVRIWTGGDLETGAAAFTAIEAAIGEKA